MFYQLYSLFIHLDGAAFEQHAHRALEYLLAHVRQLGHTLRIAAVVERQAASSAFKQLQKTLRRALDLRQTALLQPHVDAAVLSNAMNVAGQRIAYGHRTEIQNDRPLWLADLPDYRCLGLRYARLRFTTESPGECVQVFRDYLEGRPARGEFTRGLCKRGVE